MIVQLICWLCLCNLHNCESRLSLTIDWFSVGSGRLKKIIRLRNTFANDSSKPSFHALVTESKRWMPERTCFWPEAIIRWPRFVLRWYWRYCFRGGLTSFRSAFLELLSVFCFDRLFTCALDPSIWQVKSFKYPQKILVVGYFKSCIFLTSKHSLNIISIHSFVYSHIHSFINTFIQGYHRESEL